MLKPPNEKHILIHVGTYKTASSSIQNLLYHNRAILKSSGILYPLTGLIKSEEIGYRHRQLITDYMTHKDKKYVPDALYTEIKESNCQTVIMSCEAWSHPAHLAHLGGMVTDLHGEFGTVSGIAYFRNLVDYQVSHYREFCLRNGNKATYRDYIKNPMGMFDYLHLAKQYRSIFGYQINFVQFKPKDIDPVTDFINTAKITHLAKKFVATKAANQQKNSALEIEIYRQINELGIHRNQAASFIQYLKSKQPDFFQEEWTERIADELPHISIHYRRQFADLIGWSLPYVESLFEAPSIKGRHVSEVRGPIHKILVKWASSLASA